MCDRCAEWDFPIAEIWRPCWTPSSPARRRRTAPDWSDASDPWEALRLLRIIRKQQRELAALRAQAVVGPAPRPPRPSFEGLLEPPESPAGEVAHEPSAD